MLIDFAKARERLKNKILEKDTPWHAQSFRELLKSLDEQCTLVGNGNLGALHEYYRKCLYATLFALNPPNEKRIEEMRRKLEAGSIMLMEMAAKRRFASARYVLERMSYRLHVLKEAKLNAPRS